MSSAAHSQDRPRLLLRGLDSLYVSYPLDMGMGSLDWDELAYRKEKLRQARHADFAEITLGSERFALKPFGKHPYAYVLSARPFEVRLSERLRPGCYVQFSSEGLWSDGVEGLLRRIERWHRSMGFETTHPGTVSRADWAFDYHLPKVDFGPDDFVSRAAKNVTWREHRTVQTFSFGTGDTVVRVYDKVAEIAQESGKAWFHALWGQSENVWRIEFQARRERLKQAGIMTTEDLFDLQNDLLRELATKHTTLRRPSADINRSRWPLHPLWRALRADIETLPQTGLVRQIPPDMPLDWRLHQRCKSLYGSLKGIAAVTALKSGRDRAPDLSELLTSLPSLLRTLHDRADWAEGVERRITAHDLGQKW